ncbi:MAG: phosphoribosylglycinamide formyltransferase [Candidatus Omnitrophica bacterium]|nr:phosphoribosylglycinamide formyltransferase [Candidatus Omnitrophota bacterium]MDD5352928.1 phosphoribosylglycinamide formyltransferase [Candidatus Omnitrophota bacterium]MDD5550527.1 phosphoribosylglycinamide formyltransferase [Candidatus Omnitrophota bacterium]
MIKISVFCSGNGTNLQAIINAIKSKKLKSVKIALVVSDNPSAYALVRAKKAGIKTVVVEPLKFSTKSGFEKEIIKHLKKEKVQLIVLSGFMRIVGKDILSEYKNRILNIHPALLPSFKGAHGIKDAFDYGAKVTGVTVHFVDERTDHGPIILQEAVPVKKDDTLKSLEERIHKVEHKLYYKAIQLFASGRLKIAGREVEII